MKKNKNWQKNLLYNEYKFVWGGAFYKKKGIFIKCLWNIVKAQKARYFANLIAWRGD